MDHKSVKVSGGIIILPNIDRVSGRASVKPGAVFCYALRHSAHMDSYIVLFNGSGNLCKALPMDLDGISIGRCKTKIYSAGISISHYTDDLISHSHRLSSCDRPTSIGDILRRVSAFKLRDVKEIGIRTRNFAIDATERKNYNTQISNRIT